MAPEQETPLKCSKVTQVWWSLIRDTVGCRRDPVYQQADLAVSAENFSRSDSTHDNFVGNQRYLRVSHPSTWDWRLSVKEEELTVAMLDAPQGMWSSQLVDHETQVGNCVKNGDGSNKSWL